MNADLCIGFAPGCRLHPTREVVLIPEGALELRGPARAVLALVDGTRTSTGIADALLSEFEGAEPEEIRADVLALLTRLRERGVLREVPCLH
jgi:pyrroloquinoline quinone biosynthesis protein D